MIPGLLGSLSGGFRPLDIANCVLWLDASQIAGLSNGSPIASWTDLSGQGNHATQSESANKPIYISSTRAVRFDGLAQFLSIPDLSALTAAHLFLVFAPTVAGNGDGIFRFTQSSNDERSYVPYSGGGCYDSFFSTTRKDGFANTNLTGSGKLLYDVASADASWSAWGSGDLLFSTGTNTVSAPATPTIGKTSANAGGSAYFAGDFFELILYNAPLSAITRMSVESYLGGKYGIVLDQSPVNTVLPALSGTAQVGQSMSCDNGTWTNTPTTYTYQWYLEVSEATYNQIVGATTSSLLLIGAMEGLKVQCRVAASNAFAGPTEAQSADSDAIIAA